MVPRTAREQTAYDKWFDQTSDREQARLDRVHGAAGVIPTPLWIVIFFTAVLIFGYMLFFADSNERAKVQAMLMGSVVAVITAMLLLLNFLDNPYHTGVGSLQAGRDGADASHPRRSVADGEQDVSAPCDAAGRP